MPQEKYKECQDCNESFYTTKTHDNVCENCKWFKHDELIHESFHVERLKYNNFKNAEKVFADKWKEECKRLTYRNGGCGKLDLIVQDSDSPLVTQRDANVAASVIQWLGSNVGRAFISECEREIKNLKIDKNEIIDDMKLLQRKN